MEVPKQWILWFNSSTMFRSIREDVSENYHRSVNAGESMLDKLEETAAQYGFTTKSSMLSIIRWQDFSQHTRYNWWKFGEQRGKITDSPLLWLSFAWNTLQWPWLWLMKSLKILKTQLLMVKFWLNHVESPLIVMNPMNGEYGSPWILVATPGMPRKPPPNWKLHQPTAVVAGAPGYGAPVRNR